MAGGKDSVLPHPRLPLFILRPYRWNSSNAMSSPNDFLLCDFCPRSRGRVTCGVSAHRPPAAGTGAQAAQTLVSCTCGARRLGSRCWQIWGRLKTPSWATDGISRLCPPVEKGLGTPWGLFQEDANPLWGPTLTTSSPQTLPS